jgi:hypothetical protein
MRLWACTAQFNLVDPYRTRVDDGALGGVRFISRGRVLTLGLWLTRCVSWLLPPRMLMLRFAGIGGSGVTVDAVDYCGTGESVGIDGATWHDCLLPAVNRVPLDWIVRTVRNTGTYLAYLVDRKIKLPRLVP